MLTHHQIDNLYILHICRMSLHFVKLVLFALQMEGKKERKGREGEGRGGEGEGRGHTLGPC